MHDSCPDCGAIQWGNATCATCRSHWPDEPDCHEGNVGANIAGGRYSSAAQGYDDEDDGDFMDDYDCTWCSGEGQFWGSELPGYDPGWHLPDELYPCPACHGTGARKEQVLF